MGFLTAFPFAVSCVAGIIDVEAVLTTATGLPLLEIYYQGTGSRVGATVLMSLFAICFYGCAVANGEFLTFLSSSSKLIYDPSQEQPALELFGLSRVMEHFHTLTFGCVSARCT